MFDRSIELTVCNNCCAQLTTEQIELKIAQEFEGDVGCVVWDAALVLVKFLETITGEIYQKPTESLFHPASSLDGVSLAKLKLLNLFFKKRLHLDHTLDVLELGAGTGVCSFAIASLVNAKVFCTDLKQFEYLIKQNLHANRSNFRSSSEVLTCELDWSECDQSDLKNESFDLIVLPDCVYYEESVESLVQTLKLFCKPKTLILMSLEERSEKKVLVEKFWSLMDVSFTWHEVSLNEQNEKIKCEEIHLFIIYKTPIKSCVE